MSEIRLDNPQQWRPGELQPGDGIIPELVIVPPGEFIMGAPETEIDSNDSERPPHPVRIDYWLAVGRYPVTQGEWLALMGNNPSVFNQAGLDHPVDNVSWDDVQRYLKTLNEQTGHQYGFRMLSESEWEYCCRAGTSTRFNTGDEITPGQANFELSPNQSTSPVGCFPPNAFGLHDMHGNVYKWVEDPWHDNYGAAPSDCRARTMPHYQETRRVLRGGAWVSGEHALRSAARKQSWQDFKTGFYGFRVGRTLP
ncbi:MAG: formylglycine-generating enzyme family protein [Azonexus sp.]